MNKQKNTTNIYKKNKLSKLNGTLLAELPSFVIKRDHHVYMTLEKTKLLP